MPRYKNQEFCILGNAMNAGSMKLGEDVSQRSLFTAIIAFISLMFVFFV
jgi:hypothetical protein